jgi:protein involved in polysaccharide export with SLBB domain
MSGFRVRLLFMLATALSGYAAAALAEDIKLGPRDRLRIKAYDWRPSSGELHEWTALTGDFTVADSGLVSLPVAGAVMATGSTPEALADAIASQLQEKVGLARKPGVAVEVTEFRPFYVLGRVNKPGEYPSHGGLTVLRALSIAGGVLRHPDLSAYELDRQMEIARGDLRALRAERIAMLGREARLEAEIRNSDTIDFPAELNVKSSGALEATQVVKREKLLLDARLQSLRSQIEALDQTENLLKREIEAQNEKRKSLDRQIALQKKELDNVNGLVAKGLVVSTRQLALDQIVSQFESNRSDLDLLILRAQQDLAKAAREKTDIQDRRRAEDLADLTLLTAQIATNLEKMQTAKSLALGYELKGPQELAENSVDPMPSLKFSITRSNDGREVTTTVAENAIVEPGDTLTVEKRFDDTGQHAAVR